MRNSAGPVIAHVSELSTGTFGIEGELSFASANVLLKALSRSIVNSKDATLDLANVTWTDSAGVALLLELQRLALDGGTTLKYVNFPAQLLAIARVAGVEEILAGFAD